MVTIAGGLVYIHEDQAGLIKTPPASLAQWYQPENKRQVWLHNMFKLRREMQAVRFYSKNKDSKHLEKWAGRLSEHYLKIAEMVPEWENILDMEAISNLEKNVQALNYQGVSVAMDALDKSCNSCHIDYRAVTATMYRSPDFNSLKISQSTPFKDHMYKLTEDVNQIKIASGDGMEELALSSLADLKEGIDLLGETCVGCHKKGTQAYPNDMISKTIDSLEQSLKTGTGKEQGRYLGTLAVIACARCHGTHRISYDARGIFLDKPDWLELMKH